MSPDTDELATLTMEPAPRNRRGTRRVTMADVARRAGVSPSTVSLYLRKPDTVSPGAGSQIARAIAELDYVPNLVAGGLAAASSRVVSIIVPSVRNAFFAETVARLQADLGRERLQVLLGHTEYDLAEEENLVRTALSWAPAAVVIAGLAHSPATVRLLRAARVPVIEIWELGREPIDIAIGFAHDKVGAAAAEHLIGRGRRRLAFLGARMQQDNRAAQRARGFAAAAEARGLAPASLGHPAPATVEVGGMLLAQAIEAHPDLDAIACSNDHIALGALFECQRRGIAVPERLAMIGFGDLPFSAACNPALTTIRPPGELIGSEAARVILARARGEAAPTGGQVIDTHFTLVPRQSS
jgi:LacI family gluconate utilization system Gnt-I transcriptional repressor